VVACVRHTDQRPAVDPLTGAVQVDPRAASMSAADQAALEHALRLAEAWQGRALAITAGPPAADETLRLAAAAGAAVLRVPWPPGPQQHGRAPQASRQAGVLQAGPAAEAYLHELAGDERQLARALAAGIRSVGSPVLVICGDRSADRGTGALPAYLAHELAAAQATGLVALATADGTLTGERRLPGGRRERLRIPRPAVCSVEAAGVRLRRASLPATLAACQAPVLVAGASAMAAHYAGPAGPAGTLLRIGVPRPYVPRTHVVPAPADAAPRARVLALTGALIDREPPTVLGPVDAAAAADALLGYLARNGYLAERSA